MTTAENKEYNDLKALFQECFSVKFDETPAIMWFDKALKDLNKDTVNEFARILNLYKQWFIEQSMNIFPMSTEELNYRNGVVIEITKLIKTISSYGLEQPDPIFRDKGKLKSELEKKNSKILE